MNITFKQGIIKYPTAGNLQKFLQQNSDTVNLTTDNGSLLLTLSHGTSNYIIEEFNNISSAWTGPFIINNPYWLFIDIDIISGVRTFGHTEIDPYISGNRPMSPITGQHWFDLSNNKMFVFESAIWRNVVRVFTSYYDGLEFYPMGSNIPNFPFAGSQVGITNINDVAGKILYFDNKPILTKTREMFNTESVFNVNGSNIDSLRLESSYTIVKASETLPKFHVVTYTDTDTVALADYNSVNTVIGMITEDTTINNLTNIILSGVVVNNDWSWSDPIGSNLWVSLHGELITEDPHLIDNIGNPKQYPAVAKILSSTSIIFTPTYQSDAEINLEINVATINELGVVKLSTAPTNSFQPVVVTDTDPRLFNSRTPLPHVHDALDTTFDSNTGLVSTNVEDGIDEVNNLLSTKADLSGATFTGAVFVSTNPTSDNQVTNKKYVDDLVNGLIWIDPIQFINVISDSILISPTNPDVSDTYIIPNGTPLNDWSGFAYNDIVQWSGSSWILLDSLINNTNSRFGISFTSNTTPFGSFTGHTGSIGIYDGSTWTFELPNHKNAVLVNGIDDTHSYHQFVYDTKWIEYAGPHSLLPGQNLYQNGNTLNVKNVGNGGTIDALTLDGKSKFDFVDKSGDTMTGSLILNSDPTTNLEASTKQYVDNKKIDDLLNVDLSVQPLDNDFLYYEDSSSTWKSKQIPVSGSPYQFTTLQNITSSFQNPILGGN